MMVFRNLFALFAFAGLMGVVWLVLYAGVEAYERHADLLDPRYHWEVIRWLIAMPMFWGLATLAALGIAWTCADVPAPPGPQRCVSGRPRTPSPNLEAGRRTPPRGLGIERTRNLR